MCHMQNSKFLDKVAFLIYQQHANETSFETIKKVRMLADNTHLFLYNFLFGQAFIHLFAHYTFWNIRSLFTLHPSTKYDRLWYVSVICWKFWRRQNITQLTQYTRFFIYKKLSTRTFENKKTFGTPKTLAFCW